MTGLDRRHPKIANFHPLKGCKQMNMQRYFSFDEFFAAFRDFAAEFKSGAFPKRFHLVRVHTAELDELKRGLPTKQDPRSGTHNLPR